MLRRLISADSVRRAARGPKGQAHLILVKGQSVLTDEAKDLAARLGVKLVWKSESELLAPVATVPVPAGPERTVPRVQVVLASDHGGYACRRVLAAELEREGYSVRELGCPDPSPTDYPLWARALADCVASGEAARGIMLDSVGVASAMVCNRVAGIRAAACESEAAALSSRRHNDANVLTLGGRLGEATCLQLALAWLKEPYEGGRHQKRVDMIMALDPRRP
jgi:ribose 5-phosphate isomerase B